MLDFKAQPTAACSRMRADHAQGWAHELPWVSLHHGHRHTQSSLLLPLTAPPAHPPGAVTDQGQAGIQRVDSALLHVKIPLVSPRKQARVGLFLTSVYFCRLSSSASHTAAGRAPGNYSAASLHPLQQGRALAAQPQVLEGGPVAAGRVAQFPPLPWQCHQGSDNVFLHPNFCRRFVSPTRAPLDMLGSGEGAWPWGCCDERAVVALRGARAWE